METPKEVLPIKQGLILDILNVKAPALSATSDMPVIETKPDASPAEKPVAEAVPPTEDVGEAEQSEESATSATETPESVPGQPAAPRGVGKKIAELTRQREEERRRADSEHEERLRLLALLESQKTPEPEAPVKPARTDYPDDNAWDEALMLYAEQKATFEATKVVAARLEEESAKTMQSAVAEGQKIALEAYNTRKEKTMEKYADFDEVANSPDVKVSMPVAHAIIHSENGPEIQYYLGKHPDEAQRLSDMTVRQFNPQTRLMDTVPDVARQLLELGLIVGKINAPAPKPAISNVPKPLKPLKGGETQISKDPKDMSVDEYVKWRKAN